MLDYTIDELKEIIATLKTAYLTAMKSGGVTSYTIKSGQGENSVSQASITTIKNELAYYTYLLNERVEHEINGGASFIRSAGI